jgi:hypothetical protein
MGARNCTPNQPGCTSRLVSPKAFFVFVKEEFPQFSARADILRTLTSTGVCLYFAPNSISQCCSDPVHGSLVQSEWSSFEMLVQVEPIVNAAALRS